MRPTSPGSKKHLGEYLAVAAHGEETENRTRNAPPARVAPIRSAGRNRTVLGCGTGTVVVKTEPTGPMIPNDDCESL